MNEFRTKISEDGRVIIPAVCRKLLGLRPDEELVIRVENEELHLLTLRHAIASSQAKVKAYAKKNSLVNKLKELREWDKT